MGEHTDGRGRVVLLGVGDPPGTGVRLTRGGVTAVADVVDRPDRFSAVGAATLDALTQLIPPVATFTVEDVHLITGERPVVVMVISIVIGGLPILHVGSALVRDDPDTAAAKATLCAVNRRLDILGV